MPRKMFQKVGRNEVKIKVVSWGRIEAKLKYFEPGDWPGSILTQFRKGDWRSLQLELKYTLERNQKLNKHVSQK